MVSGKEHILGVSMEETVSRRDESWCCLKEQSGEPCRMLTRVFNSYEKNLGLSV